MGYMQTDAVEITSIDLSQLNMALWAHEQGHYKIMFSTCLS